ncbi:MAG: hypothetical protein ACRDRD_11625 [Pseudonocardiaceae bacterium]
MTVHGRDHLPCWARDCRNHIGGSVVLRLHPELVLTVGLCADHERLAHHLAGAPLQEPFPASTPEDVDPHPERAANLRAARAERRQQRAA